MIYVNALITSITETSWIIEQRHSKGFCLYDFAHRELLCEDDGEFMDAAYG